MNDRAKTIRALDQIAEKLKQGDRVRLTGEEAMLALACVQHTVGELRLKQFDEARARKNAKRRKAP